MSEQQPQTTAMPPLETDEEEWAEPDDSQDFSGEVPEQRALKSPRSNRAPAFRPRLSLSRFHFLKSKKAILSLTGIVVGLIAIFVLIHVLGSPRRTADAAAKAPLSDDNFVQRELKAELAEVKRRQESQLAVLRPRYKTAPKVVHDAFMALKKIQLRTQMDLEQADYRKLLSESVADVRLYLNSPDSAAHPELNGHFHKVLLYDLHACEEWSERKAYWKMAVEELAFLEALNQ